MHSSEPQLTVPRSLARLLLPVILVVVIALLVLVGEVPFDTKFWRLLFNYGHTPAFGIAALTTWRFMRVLRPRMSARRQYVVSGLLVWVLGVAIEIAQGFIGRDAEIEDVARNSLGIVGFLVLAAVWRTAPETATRPARVYRLTLSALTSCLLLLPALPVFGWLAVTATRQYQLPILVDFSNYAGRAMSMTRAAEFGIVAPPPAWTERANHQAAQITFHSSPDSDYPQYEVVEPYPDWSGYRELVIPLYNPQEVPLRLGVRADDWWHNQQPDDRYTGRFRILPGPSLLVIPLDSIRLAPLGRQTDLTRMRDILLFLYRPGAEMTLYVGDISLR